MNNNFGDPSVKGGKPSVEHQEEPRPAKFGAHRSAQHTAPGESFDRAGEHARLALQPAMHGQTEA